MINTREQGAEAILGPSDARGSSLLSGRLARFSCWCPKALAAIGRLPDTLSDRCIVIRMQRKTAREECERLRNLDTEVLRGNACGLWRTMRRR